MPQENEKALSQNVIILTVHQDVVDATPASSAGFGLLIDAFATDPSLRLVLAGVRGGEVVNCQEWVPVRPASNAPPKLLKAASQCLPIEFERVGTGQRFRSLNPASNVVWMKLATQTTRFNVVRVDPAGAGLLDSMRDQQRVIVVDPD